MNYYAAVQRGGKNYIPSGIRVCVDRVIMKKEVSADDKKLAKTIENIPTMETVVNGFASALFQEYDRGAINNLAFANIVKRIAQANYLEADEDEVLAYATMLAIKKFTTIVRDGIEARRIVLFIQRPDVENNVQLPDGTVIPLRQPNFDMRILVRFITGDDGIEMMEFTLPVKNEQTCSKYAFACKLSDSFVRQMMEIFDNDNFPIYY